MLSLFFYLSSSLLCVITAQLLPNDASKIVDIIHHNLPYLQWPYVSDALVLAQTILATTVMDTATLSEMFLIMGIVQIFRVLCSVSTILPPLKNYHDKYRLGGINGSGTEYIFSGHASYSAISAIYLYQRGWANLLPLLLYNILSQSLIVLTRNHYTVDVILAWIIVPLVYGNVQQCLRRSDCRDDVQFLLS